MTFLTGWRVALAADLLREPDVTVAAVARQVGYGSPFALSTAFKRVQGVSPREFRARYAGGGTRGGRLTPDTVSASCACRCPPCTAPRT